jgi:hypothetical protein
VYTAPPRPMVKKTKTITKLKFEQHEDDACLPFLFDLHEDHLILVDSSSAMPRLISALCSSVIVGIDTEAEPVADSPTALIQLALRTVPGAEFVFIIDLIKLAESDDCMILLNQSFQQLCDNGSVYKVGHGLIQDCVSIIQSYPALTSFEKVCGIIETNALHRIIHPHLTNDVSLKYLTRHYLNSNLIKAEQCSSWGYRPLTKSQLNYAACDALVLLRLYDALSYELDDLFGTEINISDSCRIFDVSSYRAVPSPSSPRGFVFRHASKRKRGQSKSTFVNPGPVVPHDKKRKTTTCIEAVIEVESSVSVSLGGKGEDSRDFVKLSRILSFANNSNPPINE